MALNITIPSGCYRQPNESTGFDENGNETFNLVFKGPYDTLKTELLSALHVGKKVDSESEVRSADLSRINAGLGLLTVHCGKAGGTSTSGDGTVSSSAKLLKDIWSVRAIRNDVSIIAYCGVGDYTASRAKVEAWMKEPDGKLAEALSFKQSDGKTVKINPASATGQVIGKLQKGIESVVRFYPVVTRKRTYDDAPDAAFQNLACIDTPSLPARLSEENEGTAKRPKIKYPTGISAVIAAHEWLKVDDSADENADSTWTRTESWWGILKSDMNTNTGWDPDLYSAASGSRWRMPHTTGVKDTDKDGDDSFGSDS